MYLDLSRIGLFSKNFRGISVLLAERPAEMGSAFETDHLGNGLEVQLCVLDQGLGFSQPFLYQIFKYRGAIKFLKTIFQFKLIGAQVVGQVLKVGQVHLQIVEDHIPSLPDLADVLITQFDLWSCYLLFGNGAIGVRINGRSVPFLYEVPAGGGMDHGDQNVLGTVRFGSDGRDMAAVGNDQIFIGQKTKGDCHIIEAFFTKGLPFLAPIRFGGFRQ